MSKKHTALVVEPCPEHEDRVHLVTTEVEHGEDEHCPIHVCDEEVYTHPDYHEESSSTTVGYGKKYANNYESIDWGN